MLSLVLFLNGCGGPKQPVTVDMPEPEIEEKVEKREVIIADKEFKSIPEVVTVYFKFNEFEMLDETRDKLQYNADFLNDNPQYEVLVEGHCCECGTNEYNLALGQKRASVVRDYYVQLGLAYSNMGTISYGEEDPINVNAGPPDSLLCVTNRRVETKVKRKAE
jgi:peptidoglycan-associated lipoprotein